MITLTCYLSLKGNIFLYIFVVALFFGGGGVVAIWVAIQFIFIYFEHFHEYLVFFIALPKNKKTIHW